MAKTDNSAVEFDPDAKPWEEDATVSALLAAIERHEAEAESAKKAAQTARVAAEAAMRKLIPTTKALVQGLIHADVVKSIRKGLEHLRDVDQPTGAALSHHDNFSVWVTPWAYVSVAVHSWRDRDDLTCVPVRVSVGTRPVNGPIYRSEGGSVLLTFDKESVPLIVSFMVEAAKLAGFRDMGEPWGGGVYINAVCYGPIRPSVLAACELGASGSVSGKAFGKAVPPEGWV